MQNLHICQHTPRDTNFFKAFNIFFFSNEVTFVEWHLCESDFDFLDLEIFEVVLCDFDDWLLSLAETLLLPIKLVSSGVSSFDKNS